MGLTLLLIVTLARARMKKNAGFFAAAAMASNSFNIPLTSYLISRYNMKANAATNVGNVYTGLLNFMPVVGAFVADAFWGRFRTMLFGSVVGVIVSYHLISSPCHLTIYRSDPLLITLYYYCHVTIHPSVHPFFYL
jgi:hypothetical protein